MLKESVHPRKEDYDDGAHPGEERWCWSVGRGAHNVFNAQAWDGTGVYRGRTWVAGPALEGAEAEAVEVGRPRRLRTARSERWRGGAPSWVARSGGAVLGKQVWPWGLGLAADFETVRDRSPLDLGAVGELIAAVAWRGSVGKTGDLRTGSGSGCCRGGRRVRARRGVDEWRLQVVVAAGSGQVKQNEKTTVRCMLPSKLGIQKRLEFATLGSEGGGGSRKLVYGSFEIEELVLGMAICYSPSMTEPLAMVFMSVCWS
ncbi:hypothetical protein MLD38_005395 [Melastoma candidum]|uniref:Uncharacterized protein n=1 Tax=Melastoma candidum TaxID=119954 RepID=A0ACB9RIS0_9MYRT|nr:hypothetical protein MLD38_005395 [Melastoma candidum]